MTAAVGTIRLSSLTRIWVTPDSVAADAVGVSAAAVGESAQFAVPSRRHHGVNRVELKSRSWNCDDNSVGDCVLFASRHVSRRQSRFGSAAFASAGIQLLPTGPGVGAGQPFGGGGQKLSEQWRSALGKESSQNSRRFSQKEVDPGNYTAADDNAWPGSGTIRERSSGERSSASRNVENGFRGTVYRSSVGSEPNPDRRDRALSSSVPIARGREETPRRDVDEFNYARRETSGDDAEQTKRTWGVPENLDKTEIRGKDSVQQARRASVSEIELNERTEGLSLQQSKQGQNVQLDRYLEDGETLLEEGIRGLNGLIEVGVAERMLYEAAKLFESATALDPKEQAAVGQWGNTLLVHGELKLRLSQKLRSMLPSKKAGSKPDPERESLELTLQEVCEECEDLLMDAGRKFRKALSIDKKDVRGLYNWGLALIYRGQLIAEEGGDRARQDADKVFLAAIDKFEAMLGLTEEYAPGTLLNWGIAMRYRARLRPMDDSERIRMLVQAKELFEDAMRLDPNFGEARGAVAVCAAELQELQEVATQDRRRGSF